MEGSRIKELAEAIDADRVRRARRMPPGQKLIGGAKLFDTVTLNMLSGLRIRHPGADEAELRRLLHEQIVSLRRREERGIYRVAGPVE